MYRGRGGRGGSGGGGGFRGRGGGGGGGRNFDYGPPERVVPFGIFSYPCEQDLVCKSEIEDIPYFNAPIYLENKEQVGKVDEIFGNVRDYFISVRLSENLKASSFKANEKLYIDPAKLLPLQRFLPRAPGTKGPNRGVSKPDRRGRGGGGGFGGRGRNDSGGRGGGGRGRGGGGFGGGGGRGFRGGNNSFNGRGGGGGNRGGRGRW